MKVDVPKPYIGFSKVKKDWIDANGHMNIGAYLNAFDDGSCGMFDDFGLGWEYTNAGKGTIFALSASQDFIQELLEKDPIKITTWLISYDKCRIHIFQEMFHQEKHYLAARAEFMFIHISLATRRVSDIPDKALARLNQIYEAHFDQVKSKFIGRKIGLKWKSSLG